MFLIPLISPLMFSILIFFAAWCRTENIQASLENCQALQLWRHTHQDFLEHCLSRGIIAVPSDVHLIPKSGDE